LKSEECSQAYHRLGSEFEHLVGEKHQAKFDSLRESARHYTDAVSNDPNVAGVVGATSSLFSNLFLDENGNFTIKKDLLDDFSRVVPVLNKRFSRMELPGILHEDEKVYILLDSIILESAYLIPSVFDVTTRSHVDMGASSFDGTFTIHLSHIQLSAKNMDFSFKKKSGFPQVSEVGKADFRVFDDGISVDIEYRPWFDGKEYGVKMGNCNVCIDSLDVKVRHPTKHSPFLHSLVRPWIRKILKTKLEKLIKSTLESSLDDRSQQVKGTTSLVVPKSVVEPLHSPSELKELLREDESRGTVREAGNQADKPTLKGQNLQQEQMRLRTMEP